MPLTRKAAMSQMDYPDDTPSFAGPKRGLWQSMHLAPRDGTPIQAQIPGHGKDNIIAWRSGFLDSNENECACWVFVEDQEPPPSWTDGVCWEVNEDGERSVMPTRWKPLPNYPKR